MRLLSVAAALCSAGLLAACGGSSNDAPPPANNPTGPITLTGVVATGAALANASITAKCAAGTGSAVSNTDGSYTFTIAAGGALPCVLEATSSDAALKLHSVATGSGSSATSNVTPLTELLVARLSAQDPAAYMAGVSPATLPTSVTPGSVAAAQTAVVSTLTGEGVDASAIANMVTDPLVAGSTGNAYTAVLQNLDAALTAANTTLVDLTTTVATTSASAAKLPDDLLSLPQASNCAALRSTTYRHVGFRSGTTTNPYQTDVFSFDAVTLVETVVGDSPLQFTPTGPCMYSMDNGMSTATVSPAGVIVSRSFEGNGLYVMAIAFPVQTIPLADLAGTWNTLGWEAVIAGTTTYDGVAGMADISTTGVVTNAKCFDDPIGTPEANCTPVQGTLPVLSVNPDGGFNMTSTDPVDPWTDRVFAYRAGNGDLMMVSLAGNGSVTILTKARTLGLPAVGDATTFWNISVDTSLSVAAAVSSNTNTITSVDTAAGTYARTSQAVGSTVTVPQSLAANSPRNGYTHRPAQTVIDSANATVNVREFYSMSLGGMGIVPVYLPNSNATGASNAAFSISVRQ